MKDVLQTYKNFTTPEVSVIDKKSEDNSNFTGLRLDTSHAQFAKSDKIDENSNFTGIRLDTSHAQFAKESKMNKHVKVNPEQKLDLKGDLNDQVLVKHKNKKSVIIVNETAAELMADKIESQKKEEKLVEDIKNAKNNAEVMAAAQEAAKEKVAEIK